MRNLILITITLFSVLSLSAQQKSFSSLEADSIVGGNKIKFSSFGNQSVLIVPIATLDSNFSQLFELKKLKQQYKNELVVILFPIIDFNSEPASNEQIALFLKKFNFPFLIAAKCSVKGASAHAVFKWIDTSLQRGSFQAREYKPFEKILIQKKGSIVSLFNTNARFLSNKELAKNFKNRLKD